MENKKDKVIICLRHGERSDYAGQIPNLHPCDPELTLKGCDQAIQMGQIISNELKNIKGKILIISSPFSRTLQTSRGVLESLMTHDDKCYEINKHINIDHGLCEFIDDELIKILPKDYLTIYNKLNFIEDEFKDINFNYLNFKDTLPVIKESEDICYNRIQTAVNNLLENAFVSDDVDVVILVSHGTPINNLNKILGYTGPLGCKHISYCDSFFYSFDRENKKTEFLYKKQL